MPGKLTLNTTWNRDPLPSSDQTSLAYLLIDILEERPIDGASSEAASETAHHAPTPIDTAAPINLSLVLDTSGSMGGAKLQNLKAAVRWVIDHLSPDDSLAITLFDDEVHALVPNTRLSDKDALLKQVDAIREAGGTAMSKGLLTGLDEAMKGRAADSVSRIIVLTDGQTWGDGDRCKELAAQAGAAGIPISALGVGAEEDWSIELLDDMAAASGGLSGYIAKPEEISAAFAGTVLAMQQTAVRNMRLTVNPARGVGIRAAYRVAPIISKLWPAAGSEAEAAATPPSESAEPTVLNLPLGDIQGGGTQTLLLEVLMPPRRPGQYRLARLMLNYEVPGAPQPDETVAVDVVATFSTGGQRGPGNPRVMNSVEKATTFKLQTRALQASMLGDVATATRNLRAAATRLLSIGETELAEEAETQARMMESGGKLGSAGTKKLIFDTRKLAVTEMEGTLAEAPGANQADTQAQTPVEPTAEAPASEVPTVGGEC